MAKLRMTISLDDEWAAGVVERAHGYGNAQDIARRITAYCTVTTTGAVMDPNGNTIGRVEIVEDDEVTR